MILAAALLALVPAAPAAAPPAQGAAAPPAQAAPSAPTAPTPADVPAPLVRVERRLLQKERRVFITGGPGWLARGDWYLSPSFGISATHYLSERGGAELRAIVFASRMGKSARQVQSATGLVPDVHRPVALVAGCWRRSVGYGKTLISPRGGVLHFDLQLFAGAGVLRTDRATAPLALGGPAVLARLGERLVAQLDAGIEVSFERRAHATYSPGFIVTAGLGGWL